MCPAKTMRNRTQNAAVPISEKSVIVDDIVPLW